MSNLRWKLLTILAVTVVFGAVGVYPVLAQRAGINSPKWLMDKILKLGLDLRGGVHLVMRVETDDALRSESELEMERLRGQLATANIKAANSTPPSSAHWIQSLWAWLTYVPSSKRAYPG